MTTLSLACWNGLCQQCDDPACDCPDDGKQRTAVEALPQNERPIGWDTTPAEAALDAAARA